MRPIYQAELVNRTFGDPGLYIDLKFLRRALLFDIGDVTSLSTRKLLRVSDILVSHAHMDHFAGFDHLLRVCLGRDAGVRIYGPAPFVDRVDHKLGAYTWNLVVFRLGELRDALLEFVPGQKVCYVTDIAYHEDNVRALQPLIADADLLFIEAVFLEEDIGHAVRKAHLTARHAGEIARLARARNAVPFHFSPRYLEREQTLRQEFFDAFLARPLSDPGRIQ